MEPIPKRYYTTTEVAAIFQVRPKTIRAWDAAGKLTSFRTLGGHRRFAAADVDKLRPQEDQ
jgi:excisionase family DNA binding protein